MRPAFYSKVAFTLSLTALLSVMFVSLPGQSASPGITVSVVTDAGPGQAARHGLNKLVSALKARGVAVAPTSSLEAARGETLIVAGRASASGAAAELSKS